MIFIKKLLINFINGLTPIDIGMLREVLEGNKTICFSCTMLANFGGTM